MRIRMAGSLCWVLMLLVATGRASEAGIQEAHARWAEGNHAEAYTLYTNVLFSAGEIPTRDLQAALRKSVAGLKRLNRPSELDPLLERAATVFAEDWRLLGEIAAQYRRMPHYGYIVAGAFVRGSHRGGGELVNTQDRDRVQAVRLLHQARRIAAAQGASGNEIAQLLLTFARTLREQPAWQQQMLTDLSEGGDLPDYEPGWHHGTRSAYAPTDPDGNPIVYALPDTYADARSDGERIRALLTEAARLHPPIQPETRWFLANWSYQQFGVQTLRSFNWFFRATPTDDETRDAAFALHTLSDQESMARLASGIQRFPLPPDWNYLAIYQELAGATDPATGTGTTSQTYAERALSRLADIYTNRRQYPRAAAMLRLYLDRFDNKSARKTKQKQLDQIVKPWGQFEQTDIFPAGSEAELWLRFRNGTNVEVTARPVDVYQLLQDVQAYLQDNPRQLDHEKLQIRNIGQRLLREQGETYLGDPVAEWVQELEPRTDHFDRRSKIPTPLTEAGAYLVTAHMRGGNRSSILIWIEDTVISEKRLDGETLYFVADARTGAPIPDATVSFFGFQTEYHSRGSNTSGRRMDVRTKRFARKTDTNGLVRIASDRDDHRRYRWLITATVRDPQAPPDVDRFTRLAHMGFQGMAYGVMREQTYRQTKSFGMTDRPVYRPGDEVQFTFWVRDAQYDLPDDASRHAGKSFTIRIRNPRGETMLEKVLEADAWGGFADVLPLEEDAQLGRYHMQVVGISGQTSFRVEEYKKPEFEVTVDAPSEPLLLGDTIPVTIRADYLFGAPVTEGTAQIKVTRTEYHTTFYPVGRWDWLYGNGYRWLGRAYDWFPGWDRWGCPPPRHWWWPAPSNPPELVAEIEQTLGPDGTVSFELDTAAVKAMLGDRDHRYRIQAEVTDPSRRTITGGGSVVVARDPFRVFVHVDRGHYQTGQTVGAAVHARTADGKPVQGSGSATLFRIRYHQGEPHQDAVESWPLNTDAQGRADWQFVAAAPGQYRVAISLRSGGHTREGAYIFSVHGEAAEPTDYRFDALELMPDQATYQPGENVRLRINTPHADSTILLFVRPVSGVYPEPRILQPDGLSHEVTLPVSLADMPNFFVEALTFRAGRLHQATRQILVPPVSRDLRVEVLPSKERYAPGEASDVRIRVRDAEGNPVAGAAVLAVYDRAVEYISGGSNVPDIRPHFWKWRRHHRPQGQSSFARWSGNLVHPNDTAMQALGIFGHMIDDGEQAQTFDSVQQVRSPVRMRGVMGSRSSGADGPMVMAAAAPAAESMADSAMPEESEAAEPADGDADVTVRTEFADTAYWQAAIELNAEGEAELSFPMPENLTSWKLKTWVMSHGTRVGEAATEVVTTKDLLLRMQAPRFFVEKDVVTLSANVHNYFPEPCEVRVILELDGDALTLQDAAQKVITVAPDGQTRVDWTVRAAREGEAVIRMKAIGPDASDAMQQSYPVYVHGIAKMESFSGVVRPEADSATLTFTVPQERRPAQTRLEVRYSPTLAGAMMDALPYLVQYPYGCTEQTLNRFLPTVIVQQILHESGIDLEQVRTKRTNLNAQEIGDDQERARQWQPGDVDPVFDEAQVAEMAQQGVDRLSSMQNADGGWGWFSGYGAQSYPHTTHTVVRGLLVARANGIALVPGILEKGLAWLRRHEEEQLRRLALEPNARQHKAHADNMDAAVHLTLVKGDIHNATMSRRLYQDRNYLSTYARSMLGLVLHTVGMTSERDMVIRNIEQVLVEDPENQTAYLNLGNQGYWWFWYGSEFETHAFYLKLLAATDPQGSKAAGIVKYLLNNRKHATYWNSTRDTALCIEAMADYLRASGEDQPDMTVELLLDGQLQKSVSIAATNLFSFDNQLLLEGEDLTSGEHQLTIRRSGTGPVYFNAYLSNFTLEDPITAAGLEIRVRRKVYRLVRDDKHRAMAGSHGQVVEQRRARYRREPLASGDVLQSGDLIEVELTLESKNDYEYIVVEDYKAAGFEPVDTRSGYVPNAMDAYVELRDERVAFFVRRLARGTHSVAYRLRAEIPGSFSALPAKAAAMYAPELRANSNEIKLGITDP